MIGSDLEGDNQFGTQDLHELIDGYRGLDGGSGVEVIVAFGGADKDGWRGMKFANMSQLLIDAEDGDFGDEAGSTAYLYRNDGANMDAEDSLKLFLDYLRDNYADVDWRFLTFWDHGNSYKGFGGDSNFEGDQLYLDEIERAFLRSQPGIFDLIGFDACLMASVEVARIIEPNARYMIASEELEPGHGWLWSAVIQSYAEEDSIIEAGKRMVDNFVQDVHGSPEELGKTLSLLDLSRYDQLLAALDPVVLSFTQQLLAADAYSDSLISGVTSAQSYGRSERDDTRSSVDLRHFAQLLAQDPPDAEIGSQLNALMDAIDQFVVHSNHDGSMPNSFGIAIDAPENTDTKYAAYKINDTWLDFQAEYEALREGDTISPELVAWEAYEDGWLITFHDDNLAWVTILYGFLEPVEFDDGSVEEYFMVVAELETYPTEYTGEYFAPAWDQFWLTVQYDPDQQTAWIPASFDSLFEQDGQTYWVYTAEIYYHQAGKDYSDYDFPADNAVMTLVVDENWEVVHHDIQTYQYVYSGPGDEVGTIRFDKATFQISSGDQVQFLNYGFNLDDPSGDDWFETSDFIVFVQEPTFQFEFLEFEDGFGQLIEYQYAVWAEDVSGNATLYGPIPVEP